MPDGSELHTVGAATLKPREANVVRTRTRGTDSRLVFAEHRERVGQGVVVKKGIKVSGLSGAESVMG